MVVTSSADDFDGHVTTASDSPSLRHLCVRLPTLSARASLLAGVHGVYARSVKYTVECVTAPTASNVPLHTPLRLHIWDAHVCVLQLERGQAACVAVCALWRLSTIRQYGLVDRQLCVEVGTRAAVAGAYYFTAHDVEDIAFMLTKATQLQLHAVGSVAFFTSSYLQHLMAISSYSAAPSPFISQLSTIGRSITDESGGSVYDTCGTLRSTNSGVSQSTQPTKVVSDFACTSEHFCGTMTLLQVDLQRVAVARALNANTWPCSRLHCRPM